MYVLWQYSSLFFHQSAISAAVSTSSVLGPISAQLMLDVGPFCTSNRWKEHPLHLLLILPHWPDQQKSVYFGEPLFTFGKMTLFDFDFLFSFPFTHIFSFFLFILVFFILSLMCVGSSSFHKRLAVIWALKSPEHSSLTHSFSLCLPSRQTPF